jgi:CheY-like chemotaxis protein
MPKRVVSQVKKISTDYTGHILLVDDEDMVRRSGQRLLSTLGYTVSIAANGVEALDIVKSNKTRFRLVILDLIMPVMDGETTFYKLKSYDPSLPVLLSSGYSKDEKIEELLSSGAVGFLQKPFDVNSMAAEIASTARAL